MQRSAGLYGLIRVAVPDGVVEPFAYDYDRSIILNDWWHNSTYEQATGLASIPFVWVGEPQVWFEGFGTIMNVRKLKTKFRLPSPAVFADQWKREIQLLPRRTNRGLQCYQPRVLALRAHRRARKDLPSPNRKHHLPLGSQLRNRGNRCVNIAKEFRKVTTSAPASSDAVVLN